MTQDRSAATTPTPVPAGLRPLSTALQPRDTPGRATGRLTTHVLDTAHGRPATGITVQLWRLDSTSDARTLLATAHTNADGRLDAPILAGDDLTAGTYELVFDVGAYFAAQDTGLPDPPFLGRVPVRFAIADPTAHYHVPLLVSPWSYGTYRGS